MFSLVNCRFVEMTEQKERGKFEMRNSNKITHLLQIEQSDHPVPLSTHVTRDFPPTLPDPPHYTPAGDIPNSLIRLPLAPCGHIQLVFDQKGIQGIQSDSIHLDDHMRRWDVTGR